MIKVIHNKRTTCYLCILFIAFPYLSGCKKEVPPTPIAPVKTKAPSGLKTAQLLLQNIPYTIELATSNNSRSKGLMGRSHIAPNTGMLFIFRKEQELSFHMENCLVNIDIAFLKATGEITTIHTMQKPLPGKASLKYPALDKSKYALELAEGAFKRLGLKVGDTISLTDKIKRISPEASLN